MDAVINVANRARLDVIRNELFHMANSYAGGKYGVIAVQMHNLANLLFDVSEILKPLFDTPPEPQHGRELCKTCMGTKRVLKRPASGPEGTGLTPEISCPDCLEPEADNQANTKPCPYNKAVPCVQYPDDSCGCDPCGECEVKSRTPKPLAQYLAEYIEPLDHSDSYITGWRELLEQALEAYESAENVVIQIIKKKER